VTAGIDYLKDFLPIISVIVGGLIGIGSSFATIIITRRYSKREEKESRERQRLEEAYELLLDIKKDYQGILGRCISKVHFSTPMEPEHHEGCPPIIRLEMLTNLYLKELKREFTSFSKAIDAFGKDYAEIITGNFSGLDLKEKQRKCGQLVSKYEAVEGEISILQSKIAETVKA